MKFLEDLYSDFDSELLPSITETPLHLSSLLIPHVKAPMTSWWFKKAMLISMPSWLASSVPKTDALFEASSWGVITERANIAISMCRHSLISAYSLRVVCLRSGMRACRVHKSDYVSIDVYCTHLRRATIRVLHSLSVHYFFDALSPSLVSALFVPAPKLFLRVPLAEVRCSFAHLRIDVVSRVVTRFHLWGRGWNFRFDKGEGSDMRIEDESTLWGRSAHVDEICSL